MLYALLETGQILEVVKGSQDTEWTLRTIGSTRERNYAPEEVKEVDTNYSLMCYKSRKLTGVLK